MKTFPRALAPIPRAPEFDIDALHKKGRLTPADRQKRIPESCLEN